MNVFQLGIRSVVRKPVKSMLLLLIVFVSASFIYVYTDQIEHTARRYSAWLPPIQCTLSGHQCMMLIQV